MTTQDIRGKLMANGLKVTPQRVAILEAIDKLHNHPRAEQIIEYIRENYPNIAIGTVYKVLDTLVSKNIVHRVKSDRDIMRYDADTENHHHLYVSNSDIIADYHDQKLNELLEKYFEKNRLPGFIIEDIKLQIIGKYSEGR